MRSSGPRQRGRMRIGRGRSVSLPTSVATCAGRQQVAGEGAGGVGVVELVLQHRRPDPVGADGRELDALVAGAAQVEQGAEGEGHRRVLARRVGDLARGGDDAGQRDHVDHVAAAGGDHRLQRRDGAVHRPGGVDREHRAARRLVLLPGEPGGEDAGVVDPEVERAGLGDHRGRELAAGAPRRARRGQGLGSPAVRRASAAADLRRRARRRRGVDVGRPDGEAAPGQLERDRAAEPATRSGHDRRPHPRHHTPASAGRSRARELPSVGGPSGPRGERKPLEESPDTTGQGGG